MKSRYPQPVNSDTFDFHAGDSTPPRSLVESIVLTSEICGHMLSFGAAKLLAGDLRQFDETLVLDALARCRMEVHGWLKATDIIVRIDDGRPTSDEAWAMLPKDEAASVVWTDEMAHAWGVAARVPDIDDAGAVHRAFDEAYRKAVTEARIGRAPVRWMPSLGTDTAARRSVLLDAARRGRLTASHVQQLLPPDDAATAGDPFAPAQPNIRNLH